MMMIVMTIKMFVGQLADTKTKAIVTNSQNVLLIAAEKLIPKNFQKIPG